MKAIYYLSIALLVFASCEMKKELVGDKTNPDLEGVDIAAIGAVDLNLQMEAEVDTDETLSKSGTKVKLEDFAVQVIDSLDKVLYDFDSYSEFRNADILLLEGKYTFRSSWGVLHEAAFDAPYFLSDTVVHVKPGEITSISAECFLQNAKVNIGYTDSFLEVFKDDYAAVITNTLGALTLDKDEIRVAYFATKENIKLEIQATTHKGLDIVSKHEFIDIEPNMLYDVELGIDVTVESVVNNLARPGITIDVTMHNRDTIINIAPPELPIEPGDGDGPISIQGTGISSPVEMTEAEAIAGSVPVKVAIIALAGLKTVHIKVIAPGLEAVLGDENPFELINPSEAMKGILDGLNLVRPDAGDTEYALDITGFMGLLGGVGSYQFKVDIVDNAGNKATATLTISIK